jgi:WD40 repeat protein
MRRSPLAVVAASILVFVLPRAVCFGQELWGVLQGKRGWVYSLAFSPDGKMLASASQSHAIELWEVRSQRQRGVLKGHENEVLSITFSSDGKLLASGIKDGTLKLWDLRTRQVKTSLEGPGFSVPSVALSGDGKLLAWGNCLDQKVRLWDTQAGREVPPVRGNGVPQAVAISPDSKLRPSGVR